MNYAKNIESIKSNFDIMAGYSWQHFYYANHDITYSNPTEDLAYIIHSGFISGYQNRYGDNLKPPTNVYHRMTA